MASDDLNIKLTGDASGLISATRQAKAAIDKLATDTASGWKAVSDAQSQSTRRGNASIDSQISKIKELNSLLSSTESLSRRSAANKPVTDWASSLKASSNIFTIPATPKVDTASVGRNALSSAMDQLNRQRADDEAKRQAVLMSMSNGLIKAYQGTTSVTEKQTKANNDLNLSATAAGTGGLPTLRYALYDIAGVTGNASKAILGFGEQVLTASGKFETAFTEIERTTIANTRRLELLSLQFRQLARDIPLGFADITRIGALGAQMNIANSDLAGFTKTVSQFAATTNVSIDSAAQSFGALSNLLNVPADQFNNLGSAIAYVGINSVATEREVLSVATAIAGVAAQANVSKEYVIGISGALASLRVPAEQSRGALTRIFQEVNRSAAQGGAAIQNFGNVVGMTGPEVQALLAQSGGMEQFFQKFITGLSGLNSQQLTSTLDALSLSDIRVTNVLARLSSNLDVVNQSVADSGYGFQNGSILTQLYAKKVEDLESRLTILNNSAQELSATFGDALNSTVGSLISSLSDILNGISDALSTDWGKAFSTIVLVGGAVVGVLLAVATGIITATAAAAALTTALSILGIQQATTGMAGFVASLFQLKLGFTGVTGATTAASVAAGVFRLALIAIPVIGIIAGILALSGAFAQAGQSADIAFKNMISDTSGLKTALEADAAAYEKMKNAGASQQELANNFTVVDVSAEANKRKLEGNTTAVENMADALDIAIPKLKGIGDEFDNNTRIIGTNTESWITNSLLASESFQKMFEDTQFSGFINSLSKVGFKLKDLYAIQASGGTKADLERYIRDLQLKAAKQGIRVPILLENTKGKDNLNNLLNTVMGLGGAYYLAQTGVDNYSQSANGAADATDILDNKTKNLTKTVYLLTDYANDLSSIWKRAFDIRFSGQDSMDKITDSWRKMREETDKAAQSIRELQTDIDGLTADKSLKKYFLSVAEAYGDSLTAAKLRAEIGKIDNDLAGKSTALSDAQGGVNKTLKGNSKAAIENRNSIRGIVGDYQTYIQNLAASGASQTTLTKAISQSKADFITQATQLGYNTTELQAYTVAFDDMKKSVSTVPRKLTVDFNGDAALTAIKEWKAKADSAISDNSPTYTPKIASVDFKAISKQYGGFFGLISKANSLSSSLAPNSPLLPAERIKLQKELDAIIATMKSGGKGFATGGYTGAGGKYDVAGIVHRGEYVVPASQVNQTTGMPYFMNQPRTFAQGGYAKTSGTMMVTLAPEDRALLRNVGGSGEVVLYANNEAIARSSNAGNKSIVAAGGRP